MMCLAKEGKSHFEFQYKILNEIEFYLFVLNVQYIWMIALLASLP